MWGVGVRVVVPGGHARHFEVVLVSEGPQLEATSRKCSEAVEGCKMGFRCPPASKYLSDMTGSHDQLEETIPQKHELRNGTKVIPHTSCQLAPNC